MVFDSTAQTVARDGGNAIEHLLGGEQLRRAEAEFSRQEVVDLHADAVERRLPPGVIGHDELEITNQVRRVGSQAPALRQRLHDERDIALLQVTHSPMDELRRTARRALAEIVSLQEHDAVAPRRSVDRDSDTRRPPADDGDVPGFAARGDAL